MHCIAGVDVWTASGYSTDRAENYLVDTQRSTSNTLTLTDRKKQPPTPGYSAVEADQTRSSNVPMAGFEDDVRLSLSLSRRTSVDVVG